MRRSGAPDEILGAFPYLEADDIQEALGYAAEALRELPPSRRLKFLLDESTSPPVKQPRCFGPRRSCTTIS